MHALNFKFAKLRKEQIDKPECLVQHSFEAGLLAVGGHVQNRTKSKAVEREKQIVRFDQRKIKPPMKGMNTDLHAALCRQLFNTEIPIAIGSDTACVED